MGQQESGDYTISGISNALGMGSEVKTVGRVFEKLENYHSNKISKIRVRNGKIFEYHFYIPTSRNQYNPYLRMRNYNAFQSPYGDRSQQEMQFKLQIDLN